MIGRNDPCWCGSGKKWKKCHYPEKKSGSTPQDLTGYYLEKFGILLKNREQIEGIRASGRLAVKILDRLCEEAKEGVTTEELNAIAEDMHREAGAVPAPLNYSQPPFPKSICTSLNDVICHGIPDNTPLKNGDILNIDVTCILNGYYGDCSKMVTIGEVDAEKQLVVDTSYDCLQAALEVLKPGSPINAIGKAIEDVAHQQKCSVVDQFVGHGVGVEFHETLQVPHYSSNINIPMAPGMTFTIEPMINAGKKEAVIDEEDQWTARTIDGKPSAQWEYTLLITDEGYEILTPWTR